MLQSGLQPDLEAKRPITSNFVVSEDDYEKIEQIQSQSLSILFKAIKKETNEPCAIKEYFENVQGQPKFLLEFFRELEIMVHLQHPAIMKLIGHTYLASVGPNNTTPQIILDYTGECSLQMAFKNKNILDSTARMKIMFGISSALEYMHSCIPCIIHRDLKPRNIYLNTDLEPLLCDFNQSKIADAVDLQSSVQFMESIYVAPEFYSENPKYSEAADIYSLGMIMYHLYTGNRPFHDLKAKPTIKEIQEGKRPNIEDKNLITHLIIRSWDTNPSNRPCASEIAWTLRTLPKSNYLPNTDAKKLLEYMKRIDEEFHPCDFDLQVDDTLSRMANLIVKQCKYEILKEERTTSKSIKYLIKNPYHDGTFYYLETYDFDVKTNITKKQEAFHEIEQLNSAKHPALISYYTAYFYTYQPDFKPCIFYPRLENGNLLKAMKHPKWDNTQKMISIFGIASALSYMHSVKLYHRNLSPYSILYDGCLEPYITDFNRLKFLHFTGLTKFPFNNFFPPETIAHKETDFGKADVYMFGLLTIFIIKNDGKIPFSEYEDKKELRQHILQGDVPSLNGIEVPELLIKLIKLCTLLDHTRRPLISTVVNYLVRDEFILPNVDIEKYMRYVAKSQPGKSKKDFSNINDSAFVPRTLTMLSDYIINQNNYEFSDNDLIGKGSFAAVYKAQEICPPRRTVAYKQYYDNVKNDKQLQVFLLREIEILFSLDHPAIIHLYGHNFLSMSEETPYPVIILEFMENGTMSSLRNKHNIFTPTVRMKTMFGIASALEYLHSRSPKVIHRDLKPDNIMYDENMEPRICDFNQSKMTELNSLNASSAFGSPIYKAPDRDVSTAMDIFSFGMIMYELVSGQRPYKECRNNEEANLKISRGEKPKFPKYDFFNTLVYRCIDVDPAKRPSASEIAWIIRSADQYLQGTDKDAFERYVKKIDSVFAPQDFDVKPTNICISDKIMKQCKFRLIQEIKQTNSSIVTLRRKFGSGKKYVLKELLTSSSDIETQKRAVREIELLTKSNHPAILKMHGCDLFTVEGDLKPAIILKYMENGDLYNVRKNTEKWNNTLKMITMYGVASALAHIHKMNYVHRDLTPKDILFDENFKPYISDFNKSKMIEEGVDSLVCSIKLSTDPYKSPESYGEGNQSNTNRMDIFSYGMICYLILRDDIEKPFSDMSKEEMKMCINKGFEPEYDPAKVPNDLINLLKCCVKRNPDDRPSAEQITNSIVQESFILPGTDTNEFYSYVCSINPGFIPVVAKKNAHPPQLDIIISNNNSSPSKTNSKQPLPEVSQTPTRNQPNLLSIYNQVGTPPPTKNATIVIPQINNMSPSKHSRPTTPRVITVQSPGSPKKRPK